LGWYQVRDATPSTCGHDVPADLGGRTLNLAPWGFDTALPDQHWPRATQIITAITGSTPLRAPIPPVVTTSGKALAAFVVR
jgi:hypothetical protein